MMQPLNDNELKTTTTFSKIQHVVTDTAKVINDAEQLLEDIEELEHSCHKQCLKCLWRHIVNIFCCSYDTTTTD